MTSKVQPRGVQNTKGQFKWILPSCRSHSGFLPSDFTGVWHVVQVSLDALSNFHGALPGESQWTYSPETEKEPKKGPWKPCHIMSALSTCPTQAGGLEKKLQGCVIVPLAKQGGWTMEPFYRWCSFPLRQGEGPGPVLVPGNGMLSLTSSISLTPKMHTHSILRTSWRDSTSAGANPTSPWAFFWLVGWDIDQHSSSPIMMTGFISTPLYEWPPMCLLST